MSAQCGAFVGMAFNSHAASPSNSFSFGPGAVKVDVSPPVLPVGRGQGRTRRREVASCQWEEGSESRESGQGVQSLKLDSFMGSEEFSHPQ